MGGDDGMASREKTVSQAESRSTPGTGALQAQANSQSPCIARDESALVFGRC
jgi:hypothetical protein